MSLEHRIVLIHHVIDLVCHHRGQLVIILDVIPIDCQMDAAHVDGALVICCRGKESRVGLCRLFFQGF